ncbi:FMN-binding negative transcriptional regulator [Cellulomonas timonensis]|uniref:FMN-binding negative transcriptional regulator n=1 Tax=Cellulomonas timonensis TaxID=1689271 RepID=UPI00083056F2|nr:FMN-binding negative transcriptional regulator [Cellulomonas timonensis]
MIHTADYAFEDEARLRELIRQHGWALLVSTADDGMVASHVPVLLDEDEPGDSLVIVSHVGRPDELLHQMGSGREVLLVVEGPYGYVSPSWYQHGPAVPTWDYISAHLYGQLELLDADETYRVLSQTVDQYEKPLPDPVLLPDVAEYAHRTARGAAGFRIRVTRWQGKAKLSQDKPRAVVERVVAALEDDPHYANPVLAAAVREELGRRGEGA